MMSDDRWNRAFRLETYSIADATQQGEQPSQHRRVTVVCLTTVFCGTVIDARDTKGPIPNRELGATAALIATDPLLVSALFNSSRLAWG